MKLYCFFCSDEVGEIPVGKFIKGITICNNCWEQQKLDYYPETDSNNKNVIGGANWIGTINKHPAIVLSYHGGANIWIFINGKWIRKKYDSLNELYEKLGIQT